MHHTHIYRDCIQYAGRAATVEMCVYTFNIHSHTHTHTRTQIHSGRTECKYVNTNECVRTPHTYVCVYIMSSLHSGRQKLCCENVDIERKKTTTEKYDEEKKKLFNSIPSEDIAITPIRTSDSNGRHKAVELCSRSFPSLLPTAYNCIRHTPMAVCCGVCLCILHWYVCQSQYLGASEQSTHTHVTNMH